MTNRSSAVQLTKDVSGYNYCKENYVGLIRTDCRNIFFAQLAYDLGGLSES
jgi:hypothetical protein